VGSFHKFSSFGWLVVGTKNEISSDFASVSWGLFNTAEGQSSSVSGGFYRTAEGEFDWVAESSSDDEGMANVFALARYHAITCNREEESSTAWQSVAFAS
jgi:hypothetical protein